MVTLYPMEDDYILESVGKYLARHRSRFFVWIIERVLAI